jgi:hypothetical protein
MLARGRSGRFVQRTLGIGWHTLHEWQDDPDFQRERDRILARGGEPDPRGTLIDALAARRDDGVDWPSRVRAASMLIEMDAMPATDDGSVGLHDW